MAIGIGSRNHLDVEAGGLGFARQHSSVSASAIRHSPGPRPLVSRSLIIAGPPAQIFRRGAWTRMRGLEGDERPEGRDHARQAEIGQIGDDAIDASCRPRALPRRADRVALADDSRRKIAASFGSIRFAGANAAVHGGAIEFATGAVGKRCQRLRPVARLDDKDKRAARSRDRHEFRRSAGAVPLRCRSTSAGHLHQVVAEVDNCAARRAHGLRRAYCDRAPVQRRPAHGNVVLCR